MLFTARGNDCPQVMIAVGITAVCTVMLTLFAFQTKIDFTMSSGILMCALTCLMLFGFLMFFIKSKVRVDVYHDCPGFYMFAHVLQKFS